MDFTHCVNCGSAGGSMPLYDYQVRQCIQRWAAPRLVEAHDLVCTICWSEVLENSRNATHADRKCALCNNILPPRTRSHQIISMRTDTQHLKNIKNIVIERLIPLVVRASHYICHPCWQRADRVAHNYSEPSTSVSSESVSNHNNMRCANCGIDIIRMKRYILSDETIFQKVQEQVAPRVIHATDYICVACHTMLQRNASGAEASGGEPPVGHRNVCLGCGCSLTHGRSYSLQEENIRHLLHIVRNWIQPRRIQPTDLICHTCYQRAEGAARAEEINVNDDEINVAAQLEDFITLPNLQRAPVSHSRCIFPQCNSVSQRLVPFQIRVKLFSEHKYYVPPGCRICQFHLVNQPWADLIGIEHPIRNFKAAYIEDFCNLMIRKNNNITLDFKNIEQMDDNVVWYWLGRTKEQFAQLKTDLPDFPNNDMALGTYLMKLRTGDSDNRIAKLLGISRSTVTKLVKKARDMMVAHFVPTNLGLHHITRQEVAQRNKYIPESLFGNPGSDIENRKAIIIMDGTYIFVNKSSNYSYQKKTYSLHKYRNLVKPFVVVCCDGHLIDVLGPYAATKSDADILKDEFSNPLSPMRQYFREGDVMVLDRGFRDCVPLLQELNYEVHYPLSLEPGELQMTTENANESRKVTICRWVVEVINGRFKRDFKLLRQDYSNKASGHLMDDIKVAAALTNRFHPLIEDREDARDIISIIQERMFINNYLADYVELNNMNRRRAQFVNITVNENNVPYFPRMEYSDLIYISLGVYQIKQARSYYGEHIRGDGNYVIEICREVDQEFMNDLRIRNPEHDVCLLRGKILSRHISRKIYFVYILIARGQFGREAIKQYCCNCIVGRRTVGCCAHVMTIIWYLSWARYQANVLPPAQFLDDILRESDDERE